MKEHDLADLLGDLDDRYLAEAHAAASRRPRRLVAILAAVLALVCLIGGTTAYAASESGQWILEFFTRYGDYQRNHGRFHESGYRLDFEIDRVPTNELSDALLAVGDEIVDAIHAYQPHMSHIPNIAYRRFDTPAEACAFIGYAPLFMPDLGLPTKGTTVTIWGDIEGSIMNVRIEEYLSTDDLVVQSYATLYTPNHTVSVGTGVSTLDWETYHSTEQTTPNGYSCLIVRTAPMDGDPTDIRYIKAYLIRGSIFYELHLAHGPLNGAKAEAILAQWIAALG